MCYKYTTIKICSTTANTSRRIKIRINYLNNRDILKEIHRSKTTYCSYLLPEFADYDLILPDLKKLTKANILLGRQQRATRLARVAHDAAVAVYAANIAAGVLSPKRKLDEFEVSLDSIADTDVIFRVMTWAHVPLDDSKKGKKVAAYVDEDDEVILNEYDEPEPASTTKYTKCNFPPFFHYKINETGETEIIGKSHWKGSLDTGEFCKDHGAVTRTLANMYVKLGERYGTRYNWRGYTYNDEMRGQAMLQLSLIGLQFDESKSDNPFSYYTAAITNSFTRVLNIEKRNQNIRDDILEINGLNPSYTRQGMSSGGGDGGYDE